MATKLDPTYIKSASSAVNHSLIVIGPSGEPGEFKLITKLSVPMLKAEFSQAQGFNRTPQANTDSVLGAVDVSFSMLGAAFNEYVKFLTGGTKAGYADIEHVIIDQWMDNGETHQIRVEGFKLKEVSPDRQKGPDADEVPVTGTGLIARYDGNTGLLDDVSTGLSAKMTISLTLDAALELV